MIRGRLLTPASVILGVALALILSLAYTPPIQALSPGKDGSPTIGAANTVVNTYTTLAASASAGNTSIQVGSAAVLGVAPGDLILIVQMQGVSMDTGNTASYGAITNYNNVGNYEFATVYGVSGNTILLSPCGGGLQRNYTVGGGGAGTGPGRAQVIRVPQYDTLTISAGASVTAPVWNGSTGGIVAIHAQNTVTLNGAIDVSGRGFRGGVRDNATSTAGSTVYSTYRSSDSALGGEKGEGIFGFQADYDGPNNGRFSRGAPANGGGGGNAHNAGGGGGANGDNGVAWNGLGIPDTSGLNWANAWNLEVPALATNNSS
ncbi:MAG: hypothetical protein IT323_10350, partial [Anaerolineae bacterium]|nr:hypothetical protein [Anaerolineae bacterium]